MGGDLNKFSVSTRVRSEFIEITEQVRGGLFSSGVRSGICHVFTLHTTAGLTITENADPDVLTDMVDALNRMAPWNGNYRHSEGNSAAHVKASLMGVSVTIPVEDGRLVLGTWQGIYFCEFDGPRSRTVHVTVMGS